MTVSARTAQFFLALTIFVAALARYAFLTSIPKGFNWDETAYAYNAYSLLKTGKDEWGASFPLFLKSFGEYKPALLSYLMIPLMALLPGSDIPVRAITATLGVAAVYFLFKLTDRLTENKLLALLTAFCLAIAPWHIHFSRVALDPGLGGSLLIIGLYFWTSNRYRDWLVSAVLLVFSMFAYNANRVVVLPLLVVYGVLFWQRQYKKQIWRRALPLSLIVVIGAAILQSTIFGVAGLRAKQISTLYSTDPPIKKATTVLRQYGLFWHPNFLFFADHYEANPILGFPNRGHLPELFLPFLIIGVVHVLKYPTRPSLFFLCWALIGPLPAALTWGDPHAGRAINMVPALLYLIALGIQEMLQICSVIVRSVVLIPITFLTLSIVFISFFSSYTSQYPAQSEYKWQGQYREMSSWTHQRAAGRPVSISATPELHALLFYAWYNRVDPQLIHKAARTADASTYINAFGNVVLLDDRLENWKCTLSRQGGIAVLSPEQRQELTSLPIHEFFYYNPSAQSKLAFAAYDVAQLNASDTWLLKTSCRYL